MLDFIVLCFRSIARTISQSEWMESIMLDDLSTSFVQIGIEIFLLAADNNNS